MGARREGRGVRTAPGQVTQGYRSMTLELLVIQLYQSKQYLDYVVVTRNGRGVLEGPAVASAIAQKGGQRRKHTPRVPRGLVEG